MQSGSSTNQGTPTRPSNHVALKVVGVVTLALVLVVVGIVSSIYESFGGYAYHPTDRAVRAARITADGLARKDVEAIVTRLSPIVGEPARRAVVDYCWDTAEAWSFNNDIACARVYYLYYPLGSSPTMPSGVGTMSWPSTGASHVDLYVDRAAEADYASKQGSLAELAEMDGYRELLLAASGTHSLVVTYSVTYFEG